MAQVTPKTVGYGSVALAGAIGAYALSWSWSERLQVVGNVAFWLLTCAIAAAFVLEARRSPVARRWLVAAVGFGGALALSALWSVAPSDTVREAVKFTAVLLMAASVGAHLQSAAGNAEIISRRLAWLAPAAIALTAIVVLVGLVDAASVPGPGASGFFNGPNVLSIFLALTLPFLLTRPTVVSRPLLTSAVLGLTVFTAVLSAGRTGVGAMALGVAAIAVGARSLRRLGLYVATWSLAVGLAVLWSPALPTLGEHIVVQRAEQPHRGAGEVRTQSLGSKLLGARDEGWGEGLRLLDERPLSGHGFGTGSTLFDRYGSRERFTNFVGAFAAGVNPHNSYLQMLLELGIAGGIFFLAPILAALSLAVRILARSSVTGGELAFCGVLVAACAAAFFESTLTQFGALTLLSWLAAAAVGGQWLRRRGEPGTRD